MFGLCDPAGDVPSYLKKILAGGVERLLETLGAVQGRRAPHLVDLADAIGDLDPALGRHLLADDGHGEDGGEIRWGQRLECPRAQERAERLGDVREDVVPVRRQIVFRQQELRRHPFHLCQSRRRVNGGYAARGAES